MKTIWIPQFKLAPNEEGNSGGGSGAPPATPPNTNTDPPKDEAAKERERLLNENNDLRKKTKEAEGQIQQIRDELANLKKDGAKGQGDWKKVAEQLESEVTTLKSKAENLQAGFKNTLVSARLREEALKQGAKSDMVDLIDSMEFDEVEFSLNEQEMRFNVKGVDTAISNLKKLRPSFFGDAKPPTFNKGGPGAPPAGAIGLEDAKNKYVAAMKTKGKDPEGFKTATQEYLAAIKQARKGK